MLTDERLQNDALVEINLYGTGAKSGDDELTSPEAVARKLQVDGVEVEQMLLDEYGDRLRFLFNPWKFEIAIAMLREKNITPTSASVDFKDTERSYFVDFQDNGDSVEQMRLK